MNIHVYFIEINLPVDFLFFFHVPVTSCVFFITRSVYMNEKGLKSTSSLRSTANKNLCVRLQHAERGGTNNSFPGSFVRGGKCADGGNNVVVFTGVFSGWSGSN